MRYGAVLAVLFLVAGAVPPAAAQHAREHVRSGSAQPLDEILEGIRASRPGSFYDAEGPFEGPDGRMHYRIKWMTPEGRILWLDTDARTGRVLGTDAGGRRPAWDRGRERGEDRDGDRPRERRYVPDRGERFRDGAWPDRDDRGGRGDFGRGSYDRGGLGGWPGGGRGGQEGGGNRRPHGW